MTKGYIYTGILCILSTPAYASEDGTQHYPVGVNTVSAGNLPLPGMLSYQNYFQVAPLTEFRGPDGASTVPDFKLTAIVNASRFLYTWKNVEIGGLHYTTGVVVPVVRLNLNAAGHRATTTGVADINIQNYLGGANKDHTFFYYFGLDTFVPVGKYSSKNPVNPSRNYFTFAPNVNFTWIPDKRWEVTGTVFTQFNTTNKATKYHSGSDITFDYGVSYRPFTRDPNVGLGLNGYFFKQLGRDTLKGASVAPDGNKGQEFAIGPQVRYDIPFGGFALKLQHTFSVRNRPSGNRIWFQFAVPLTGIRKHN